MPTYTIKGVTETVTGQLMVNPPFANGYVTINVGGVRQAIATPIPTVHEAGYPELDITLTDAEVEAIKAGSIVRFKHPTDVWIGPTITAQELGTLAKQDTILARLADASDGFQPLGSPLQGGVLKLVQNKDYAVENANTFDIPLPGAQGLGTADEVLLTIRNRATKVHQFVRLAAISFDDLNATFAIPAGTLNYEDGAKYEYSVEIKHGARYKEYRRGNHILFDDISS